MRGRFTLTFDYESESFSPASVVGRAIDGITTAFGPEAEVLAWEYRAVLDREA